MDDYIPMADFGRDHWSTLAYADTIIPDHQGFQVGFDARMRQNRRHYRVMLEECPKPRRPRAAQGVVMDPRYTTVLKDGSTAATGHDDWSCVQDLVHAGLMGVKRRGLVVPLVEDMEPGVSLFLTPLGENAMTLLKRHRADGGSFATWTALNHTEMFAAAQA